MRRLLRIARDEAERPALANGNAFRRGGRCDCGGNRQAQAKKQHYQRAPVQMRVHGAAAFQWRSIHSWWVGIAATALASMARMLSTTSTSFSSGMSSTIG